MKKQINLSKKKISRLIFTEKLNIGLSIKKTHVSQYSFVLLTRNNQYTILNPFFFKLSFRFFFKFIKGFFKKKGLILVFYNFNNNIFLRELINVSKNYITFLKVQNESDFQKGRNIIQKKYYQNPVIISFFLSANQLIDLRKETKYLPLPFISFTDQKSNFFLSDLQILGNFKNSSFQYILVSVLILYFFKKK